MGYPNNSNFFVKKQDVLINLAKQVAAKDGLITLNSIVENILENVVSNLDPANPQNLNGSETLLVYKEGDLNSLTMMDLYTIFTGGNNDLPEHDISQHSDVQGNPQNGDVLTYNAGYWEPQELPTNTGWSLEGNSGTNYEDNFIGTTDGSPVTFRTNNQMVGILTPNAVVFGPYANPAAAEKPELNTIAIGNFALATDPGYAQMNVAIGNGAMQNVGTAVAPEDLVVGRSYIITSVGDTDFTLVGANENSVGTFFTATGTTTGTGTVVGNFNTNISIGWASTFNAVTGYHNVAVGTNAAQNLEHGDFNIFIGSQSGQSVINGTDNIAIGRYSSPANNENNQIVIGNDSSGMGDNTTVLGGTATTETYIKGSVVLGTMSPPDDSALLQLNSSDQGFLPPRMIGTAVEAIVAPAEGLLVYAITAGAGDIVSKGWWGFDGTNWVKLN